MGSQRTIRTKVMRIAAVGALLAAASVGAVDARGGDAVSVFASAPAPGHPFGIAVGDGRVYVSTSAGDFFADPANGGHKNSDDERVFTYDEDGTLLDTTVHRHRRQLRHGPVRPRPRRQSRPEAPALRVPT